MVATITLGTPMVADPEASRAAYLAALEVERAGYVHRGLEDRAAQVTAQIERLQSEPLNPAEVVADETEEAEAELEEEDAETDEATAKKVAKKAAKKAN